MSGDKTLEMNYPKISLIAAIASGNRALGKDNKLLYRIPKDLERFKKLTTGHVVIMGRKTFESIGRALPNRMNVVVTTHPDELKDKGVFPVSNIREAFYLAEDREKKEIFVIGGANIYEQTIGRADKLYLTIVEGNPPADAYFPDYSDFKTVVLEKFGEYDNINYRFVDLEK